MNDSVLELEGSNYEVGFGLGKWWMERMSLLIEDDYKHSLKSKKIETKYFPLLDYAYKNFPDLMDEIKGMADGITKGGWKTSIGNVFLYCLGESWGCSSFVLKKKNSILMGHNEESDKKYPLCVAKVKLNGQHHKEPIEFVSVSYPFQLFGSVGGMNRYLAFQGNSIGYNGKPSDLESTWSYSAPKTFLTRKMLECWNIEEIEDVYFSHYSTLPSHHFIVMANEAWSLEVRPALPGKTFMTRRTDEIFSGFAAHTNHFIKSRYPKYDLNWRWNNKHDRKDSEMRLSLLTDLVDGLEIIDGKDGSELIEVQSKLNSNKDILRIMETFKLSEWDDVTSASLSFHMRKNSSKLSIKRYYGSERKTDVSITK